MCSFHLLALACLGPAGLFHSQTTFPWPLYIMGWYKDGDTPSFLWSCHPKLLLQFHTTFSLGIFAMPTVLGLRLCLRLTCMRALLEYCRHFLKYDLSLADTVAIFVWLHSWKWRQRTNNLLFLKWLPLEWWRMTWGLRARHPLWCCILLAYPLWGRSIISSLFVSHGCFIDNFIQIF